MDSEKGNRVFARGHNVPPPLVFGAPKKPGLDRVIPLPDDEDDTAVIYYRPARKESSAVHLCSHVSCANTRETAARIVLVNELFRAITRQVEYMAMHCTPKMKELNLSTTTWQN